MTVNHSEPTIANLTEELAAITADLAVNRAVLLNPRTTASELRAARAERKRLFQRAAVVRAQRAALP